MGFLDWLREKCCRGAAGKYARHLTISKDPEGKREPYEISSLCPEEESRRRRIEPKAYKLRKQIRENPEDSTGRSATAIASAATNDEGRQVSRGLHHERPLEVRHVQSFSTTTPEMEFSPGQVGGFKRGEANEGILRFGTDTIYVGANHFGAVEDNDLKRELLKKSIRRVAIEIFSYCNRQCWFCPNASGQRHREAGPELIRATNLPTIEH